MDLLKAIIKAELNTRQLSILYTLLKENTKTISLTSEEIAKKVKVKSDITAELIFENVKNSFPCSRSS